MNESVKVFYFILAMGLAVISLSAEDVRLTVKPDSGMYSNPEYPGQLIKLHEAKYKASEKAIKNWQAQRFGMFIHWGAYSVLEGKWQGKKIPHLGEQIQNVARISGNDYLEHAVKKFNPVKFDPKEYVELAKAAGMKYIILTSKHHDGFCMFDSKYTDYDIMDATPYKKDIVKMFADACKEGGIKFGVYYSNPDWHHGHDMKENRFNVNEKLSLTSENFLLEQKNLRELLSNYGPMFEVFFDMGGPSLEVSEALARIVRELQPNCLSSGRIMKHQGDFLTMSDNSEPPAPIKEAWEVPCTLSTSPGHTWGYKSWVKNPTVEKEVQKRTQQLGRIASRGGNYLLNIGPKPDGTIQKWQAQVLHGIGKWTEVNKEAIFDTNSTPFDLNIWGEATWKDEYLYLQIPRWPRNGKLTIPNLASRVKSVSLLQNPVVKYKFNKTGDILNIEVPKNAPDKNLTILKVECDGIIKTNPSFASEADGKIVIDKNNLISENYYHGLAYGNNVSQIKIHGMFDVKKASEYDLKLTYRTTRHVNRKKPLEFVITIGGKELHFILPFNDEYTSLDLGKLELNAGRQKVIATLNADKAIKKGIIKAMNELRMFGIQIKDITLTRKI